MELEVCGNVALLICQATNEAEYSTQSLAVGVEADLWCRPGPLSYLFAHLGQASVASLE